MPAGLMTGAAQKKSNPVCISDRRARGEVSLTQEQEFDKLPLPRAAASPEKNVWPFSSTATVHNDCRPPKIAARSVVSRTDQKGWKMQSVATDPCPTQSLIRLCPF